VAEVVEQTSAVHENSKIVIFFLAGVVARETCAERTQKSLAKTTWAQGKKGIDYNPSLDLLVRAVSDFKEQ
jgi:alcohol dehydrogenase YqhD (iron-dependent ADH family)